MAVVDEKKAKEELRKKKFYSLYYCYGEDPFKLSQFQQHLQAALLGDDSNAFNVSIFHGDELNASELLSESESLSLWQTQKRLMIIRGAERIPAKQQELLRKLLDRPNEDNVVIFISQKADARTKWIQAIQKSDHALLVHFEAPVDWELAQAARQFAKEEGKEIDESAIQQLVEWNQGSLGQLKQSVVQAALFSPGADLISAEAVRAIAVKLRPDSAFELTDAILKQNRALAVERLQFLLDQGEEPLALLGLLVRQYRWLLAILAAKAEGRGENEIISELRLFPKLARELFSAAKRYGSVGVRKSLDVLKSADLALKSSREPAVLVMTRLIIALTE